MTSPAASSSARVGIGKTGSPVTLYGPDGNRARHHLEHGVDGVRGRAELGDRAQEHAREVGRGGRPAPRAGRTTRIASSFIACARRMHSSSSGGLGELRRHEHRARVDDVRDVATPSQSGNGRVVDRDAARRRSFRRARRRPPRSRLRSLDGGIRPAARPARPRGSRCRDAATARPARAPQPRATTMRERDRPPARARPIAYETFCWPQRTSVSTPAAPIAASSFATRSRRMRARSSAQIGSVTPAPASALGGLALGGLQVDGDARDEAVGDVEHDGLVGVQPGVAVVDRLAQLDRDAVAVGDHVGDDEHVARERADRVLQELGVRLPAAERRRDTGRRARRRARATRPPRPSRPRRARRDSAARRRARRPRRGSGAHRDPAAPRRSGRYRRHSSCARSW